jgi:hypothetical protein
VIVGGQHPRKRHGNHCKNKSPRRQNSASANFPSENTAEKQGMYGTTLSLPEIIGIAMARGMKAIHSANVHASGRLRKNTDKIGSIRYICTSIGSVHSPSIFALSLQA